MSTLFTYILSPKLSLLLQPSLHHSFVSITWHQWTADNDSRFFWAESFQNLWRNTPEIQGYGIVTGIQTCSGFCTAKTFLQSLLGHMDNLQCSPENWDEVFFSIKDRYKQWIAWRRENDAFYHWIYIAIFAKELCRSFRETLGRDWTHGEMCTSIPNSITQPSAEIQKFLTLLLQE